MTERLARASALHPWRTIGAWLLAIVLAFLAVAMFLGDNLTTEGEVTNNPESLRAEDAIADHFPVDQFTTELIVVSSNEHEVDDQAFQERLDELRDAGERTGVIAEFQSPDENPDLVSPDRSAVLIPIRLRAPEDENVTRVVEVVEEEDGRDGFQVAMTGNFTTDHDFNEVSERDLQEGELRVGLPAALVVLVIVFGALVAAALPLVLAVVSIVVALGLTALVAQGFELSIFVVNMLTGMGLALGIDYALFVVSRFREERAAGSAKLDAIATAGATASRAVLFSGTAFVLAMIGLLLVQSTIMRSLAVGAILVGVTSVVAALTVLPAVLSLLGDRVNRLRVPFFGRSVAAQAAGESRFWGAIVRRVVRRPLVSFALAAALLLAAAAPILGLQIGGQGIATLPDSLVSKQGFLALEREFPAAGADPAEVVVLGGTDSPEVGRAIASLQSRLEADETFGPPTTQPSADGEATLITVPVAADALSEEAIDAVERLRSEHIPAAFAGTDARALVAGATAENIDYFDVMRFWLPIVIAFVLGLSLILLTVAFRSIVVAATAILVNLLSVGAAYGLVVAVFQYGVGADLLGFQQVDTIEAWVPPFLFAVLFGLSMDYQVFLLSRIRERYSATGDTAGAVTFGIGSTARIITGAALIIIAVFIGFAAGDLVMFQQMGFGVAIALLIDATLVRSVLVPALMTLLGEHNWYLPRWLDWLPHLEVEGGPRERRARPAAPAARAR
ncbi:MAG TPA: MMPL family transporter [Gaiellaceae bacterium]|nr:MMPL family transporter [Gaiellaceae bacterium]